MRPTRFMPEGQGRDCGIRHMGPGGTGAAIGAAAADQGYARGEPNAEVINSK